MANREKGEVSFEIDGTSYTLLLDLDAMCQCESMFSTAEREVTFQDVLDRVNAGSMRHIRAMVWAALKKHQPDIKLGDVSALIQRAGGVVSFSDTLMRTMGKAVEAAIPDPDDVEATRDPSDPPNPQTAQASGADGTGKHSKSKRVA